MAMSAGGVWAIDIGSDSLKALRLRATGEGIEVIGFDYISYSRGFSRGNIDDETKRVIISEALGTFVSRNDLGKDEVAISIAGHNSFVRFVKLPPVEPKRIPQIVQFEAVQQIPFDINEVEWDWQLVENPDSPDKEVGIFAIKNELINEVMSYFGGENIRVSCVQIAPMALYNYAIYDRKDIGTDKGVVILDIGAQNTTVVVCSQTSVWQRSIRIGGNAFTEAIADTFKLKFAKAEKLKHKAPMSKYVRQIFTAMRPVFTNLGAEIQRSLGFYTSSNIGGVKSFSKIIALGGGMKLQGVSKYLQQTLNIPVVKPDSFERLRISSEVSAAKFHENVSDFGVVYGLGVQLLGEAKIRVNLLPRKLARAMAWARKARYFMIAACILLAVSVLGFVRVYYDGSRYNSSAAEGARRQVAKVVKDIDDAGDKLELEQDRDEEIGAVIEKHMDYFKFRDAIPLLNQAIIECLPNATNNREQAELYKAFDVGDVDGVTNAVRSERKQIFVTSVVIDFASDLPAAAFETYFQQQSTGARITRSPAAGYKPSTGKARKTIGGAEATSPYKGKGEVEENTAGFVVMIEGYSPYQNIDELMDPMVNVKSKKDMDKWGFITRLDNLDEVVSESEFKLYGKSDAEHFMKKTGEVELGSSEMPQGIGVEKTINNTAQLAEGTYPAGSTRGKSKTMDTVLIDPMTSEEIGKTYDIITQADIDNDPGLSSKDLGRVKRNPLTNDQEYIVRDHWFRVYAKFLWKNAPVEKDDSAAERGGRVKSRGTGRTR